MSGKVAAAAMAPLCKGGWLRDSADWGIVAVRG